MNLSLGPHQKRDNINISCEMGSQGNEKHLEECTVSKDVGILSTRRIDGYPGGNKAQVSRSTRVLWLNWNHGRHHHWLSQCEREHTEHQKKLLQHSQNAAANNNADTDSIS
ncbi:hypothetical protein Bca52824_006981 [Brassica carinata]|uniref:Uncharacterized protein n=1 Tax=Brassica carinata TaxID=52824 RepID=A0A8X7W922_BRACI|nr:hypothetical protein Bca52824_006981 [Brassica carinata]